MLANMSTRMQVPSLGPATLALCASLSVWLAGTARAQAPTDLADAFAEWQVDDLTRSDGPSSFQQLTALIESAESAEPQDVALLARLYRAELDALEQKRDLALFERAVKARLAQALTPGADSLGQAARRALDVATVERLLVQVRDRARRGEDGPRSADEELIAAAVADALERGDEEFISQLGLSAAAPLVAIARGPVHPESTLDPLELLARIEPGAALDIALEHASSGDILRKMRVVRAFGVVTPFASDSVWKEIGIGQYEPLRAAWAGLLTELADEPSVADANLVPYLAEFARRDFEPEGAAPLFRAWLARSRPTVRVVPDVLVRAATSLLDAEESDRRERAAALLLDASSVEPLFSLSGETEPRVRNRVANAFGARKVSVYDETGEVAMRTVYPVIDERFRNALFTFARGQIDEPAGRAIRLAGDAAREAGDRALDPNQVWELILSLPSRDEVWFGELVQHLAPFSSLERASFDEAMVGWISRDDGAAFRGARVRSWLNVIQDADGFPATLLTAGVAAHLGLMNEAADAVCEIAPKALANDPEHAAELFKWLREYGEPRHWTELIESERSDTGLVRYEPFVGLLDEEATQDLIRGLWSANYDKFDWLDEDELSLTRESWLDVVADERLPIQGRAWALKAMCDADGPPLAAGAARVIAHAIATIGESPTAYRDYRDVGVDPDAILLHLMENTNATDDTILGAYPPLEDPLLIERVRKRFPSEQWSAHADSPLLAALVGTLVRRADPGLNAPLRAANIPGSSLQRSLIESAYYLRSPVHLDLMGEVLQSDRFLDDRTREYAIEYVAGFLNDEAAGYLIEAARAGRTERVRQELFAALEKVLAWREAEARWRRGSDAAAKREASIADLALILEDEGESVRARVEAARGLGVLGAAEEIPRLIRALDAEDEDLREAVRAALDRISER